MTPGRTASLCAALVGLFLLLPLLAVVPVSFTPARFLSMPEGEWSLRHYRALVEDPRWLAAAWVSLRIGVASAALATALALAFSLGLWMLRPRVAGLLMGLALLPMVAPPVVSALTLYFLLITVGRVFPPLGYDSFGGVMVAHAVMIAPFAVVLISAGLMQVDRRIDMAARAMGAGIGLRVWRIILPNIRFSVVAAFVLTFVLSWEEIGVTIFITSVDTVTLPRLMWMGLRDNIDSAIAAVSVLLIGVVCVVVAGRALAGLVSRR